MYFYLHSHVRITKGYVKSIVCDLKKFIIYNITNSFADVLIKLNNNNSIEDSYENYEEVTNKLNEIEKLELGYFSDSNLNLHTSNESKVSNEIGMLWLNLTSRCNYKCSHCYEESDSKIQESQLLSIDDYKSIINNINTKYGIKALQLIGGEPLLKGKLFIKELVQCIVAEHIPFIEIYTNCSLLDEDYCRFFSENGVRIATSMYSQHSARHDKITGVQGSFNNLLSKIQLLKDFDLSFRVSVVIMEENKDELYSIHDFLKNNLGISDYKVDVVRPIGRGRDHHICTPTLFRKRIINKVDLMVYNLDKYDYNAKFQSCWGDKMCINSSGQIFPCIMSDYCAGNIKDIDNIWALDSSYRHLNNSKVETCSVCEYRYICADCKAMNGVLSQSALLKKPYYCTYNPFDGKWNDFNEDFLTKEILI